MQIIESWMHDFLFTFVLSAEYIVDIFFWLTAFLGCYFMLSKMQQNEGVLGNCFRIYLERLIRLWPAYMVALFFFWKVLVLFGGDGPMFYMYSTQTQCSKYWLWHLIFINNMIPFAAQDTCMQWTWYLANDFQFYLTLPLFAILYYRNRKWFYIVLWGLFFVSKIIQMAVILGNSLSISYFTYKDEYWTIYYVKPYSRLPIFLIGVLAGCSYFTYKKEDPETQRIAKIIEALEHSPGRALLSGMIGMLIMLLMIIFMQLINNLATDSSRALNLFFLLLSRPAFILGFSMIIFPIIAGSLPFRPMRDFLSHSFWVPFSRLSYGAFLAHGIFMQFREYNTERGHWACAFDAILFFFAYWTFSFLFGLAIWVSVESPVKHLWIHFIHNKHVNKD